MATLQLRVDDELKRKSDDLFQSNVCRASEDLSLEKAISDTRKQENLHGHYCARSRSLHVGGLTLYQIKYTTV